MTQFYGKTKIFYGDYALDTLETLPCTRAFVVTDPFMAENGFADQVTSHLERHNVVYTVFSDVEPDPTLELVQKGTVAMLNSRPDIIIALGGGSAIDAAKAIAYFTCKASPDAPRPDLIAIPTTSGTGSEVTSLAVITDTQQGVKIPLKDDILIPDMAILDARFTVTVPPHVTAATGMDVLTHAIEAYTARAHNPFSDILAVQAVRYVFSYLLKTYHEMENMEAREKMLLGSCMAGMAFNNSGLGITHSLAHALGGQFHIPHGVANAIFLPHVIRFNSFDAGVRYRELARLTGLPYANTAESIHSLVSAVTELNRAMTIPTRIRDCTHIEEHDFQGAIDSMAEHAIQDMCTQTNPRRPSVSDLRDLFRQAW